MAMDLKQVVDIEQGLIGRQIFIDSGDLCSGVRADLCPLLAVPMP